MTDAYHTPEQLQHLAQELEKKLRGQAPPRPKPQDDPEFRRLAAELDKMGEAVNILPIQYSPDMDLAEEIFAMFQETIPEELLAPVRAIGGEAALMKLAFRAGFGSGWIKQAENTIEQLKASGAGRVDRFQGDPALIDELKKLAKEHNDARRKADGDPAAGEGDARPPL